MQAFGVGPPSNYRGSVMIVVGHIQASATAHQPGASQEPRIFDHALACVVNTERTELNTATSTSHLIDVRASHQDQ